jgi:thiamine-monophosphate kinase
MGGIPCYALASFVLREDVHFDWLKEVLEGIREEAENNDMEVIGGNLACTRGEMVLDIVVLGEVEQSRPLLLRRNARVGDVIFVTGYPGEAGAGFLLAERQNDPGVYRPLLERFLLPEPRLRVGRFLGEFGARIALIDISDGFLQDLGHILEESEVGALLFKENIPVSSLLAQFCKAERRDPFEFVFQGGEDFELIFTVPRDLADVVERYFKECLDISLHRVGEIIEGRGILLEEDGRVSPLSPKGWNHFTPKEEA